MFNMKECAVISPNELTVTSQLMCLGHPNPLESYFGRLLDCRNPSAQFTHKFPQKAISSLILILTGERAPVLMYLTHILCSFSKPCFETFIPIWKFRQCFSLISYYWSGFCAYVPGVLIESTTI